MDPRTTELMNLAIDGELDAAGSEELRGVIERDTASRSTFHELQQVADLLDSSAALEPPSGLLSQTMNAVARSKVMPFTAGPAKRRFLPLHIAVAAAAGILLVFLFAPAVFDGTAPAELRGTMREVTPALAITASSVPLSEAGHTAVDVRVVARGLASLHVEYDARALELQSVEGRHGALRTLASGRMNILDPQPPSLRLHFRRMTAARAVVTLRVSGGPSSLRQKVVLELPPVTN